MNVFHESFYACIIYLVLGPHPHIQFNSFQLRITRRGQPVVVPILYTAYKTVADDDHDDPAKPDKNYDTFYLLMHNGYILIVML